jgi:hypothetical protein
VFVPSERRRCELGQLREGNDGSPRMGVVLGEFKLVFGNDICTLVEDDAAH